MNNTKFKIGDKVVIQKEAIVYAVSENSIDKIATIIAINTADNYLVEEEGHRWYVYSRDLKPYKKPYEQLLLFE